MKALKRVLGAAAGTAKDLARGLGKEEVRAALTAELGAALSGPSLLPWLLRAWRGQTMVDALARNAKAAPNDLALVMDGDRLSWRDLDQRSSRLARILISRGIRAGDVVALRATGSPRYVVTVFGIVRAGATAALLNYHLQGRPLAHAVSAAKASLIVAEDELVADLPEGCSVLSFSDLDGMEASSQPLKPVRSDGDYVYIYTSGTTGLPKPCRVSHGKALLAGAAFGEAIFDFRPGDVLYSVLPLYHASALVIGVGSSVTTRTTLALRSSFSAREFWPDVERYGATALLYIGELCRYLVGSPEHPAETRHKIRVAAGNGLRPDVWVKMQSRFGISNIREFYAATEAPGFIVNFSGRIGSVGHVPMRRADVMRLARFDTASGEHIRADGFMVDCPPDEAGELLVKLPERPLTPAMEFRGYTDEAATKRKILHGCFEPGDRYFRTGDLLRRDEDDFFFFVDRIGDTFRWKGENVSTAEVADVLAGAPGVAEATVVGVKVPNQEGRAGLAAVVPSRGKTFDAAGFYACAQELPAYSQPRFVRVMTALDTTGTFKVQKGTLEREGADPSAVGDALFVRTAAGYEPLSPEIWQGIVDGKVRL